MEPNPALSTAQPDTLHARVRAYADAARADQALLVDMSGHMLAAVGMARQDDVALGALLAGLFGSARQLAEMCGERDFRAFFQQGVQTSIYTLLIGDRWLLVTIFGRHTQVGLVRLLASEAAADLADILARESLEVGAVRDVVLSEAFRASFDDTLDRLFQDNPAASK